MVKQKILALQNEIDGLKREQTEAQREIYDLKKSVKKTTDTCQELNNKLVQITKDIAEYIANAENTKNNESYNKLVKSWMLGESDER